LTGCGNGGKDSAEVYRHYVIEIGKRDLFQRGSMPDAGAVDQYIQTAEFLDGTFDGRCNLAGIAIIGLQRQRLAAIGQYPGDHGIGLFLTIHISDYDCRPIFREPPRNCGSDATASASDESNLPVQSFCWHVISFLYRLINNCLQACAERSSDLFIDRYRKEGAWQTKDAPAASTARQRCVLQCSNSGKKVLMARRWPT